MRAVAALCSYQAIRAAEIDLTYNEVPRDSEVPVQVICFWGASGAGKSREVSRILRENDEDDDAYWSPGNKWFPGYDNHGIVVLDDFRGSWWRLNTMLKIIDRHPYRIENKGGHRQMRATRFYITSIKHPREWYNQEQIGSEPIEQILRRITEIRHFPNLVPEVGVPEVEGNNRSSTFFSTSNGDVTSVEVDHDSQETLPDLEPTQEYAPMSVAYTPMSAPGAVWGPPPLESQPRWGVNSGFEW